MPQVYGQNVIYDNEKDEPFSWLMCWYCLIYISFILVISNNALSVNLLSRLLKIHNIYVIEIWYKSRISIRLFFFWISIDKKRVSSLVISYSLYRLCIKVLTLNVLTIGLCIKCSILNLHMIHIACNCPLGGSLLRGLSDLFAGNASRVGSSTNGLALLELTFSLSNCYSQLMGLNCFLRCRARNYNRTFAQD